MGFSKPSVQIDWISDDAAGKYTTPSGPDQLAGHISDTNADPKIFNWCWWRLSHWIEFLDNTFDSNGNEVNAPKSTTITETVSPAASTVTLDTGGIKSWDGSSNAIFSVTEPGVVTIGYNGNDIISLTAGALSVCTASAADLVKLHAITPSAADINPLLGASGNGLAVADITKLANIDASDVEIDQLDGVTVGGSSAGDIATINDTQTFTNKSISGEQINSGTVAAARIANLDGSKITTGNIDINGTSRTIGLDGDDSNPCKVKTYGSSYDAIWIQCNSAGSEGYISPSYNNVVNLNIGHTAAIYNTITFNATNVDLTGPTVSLTSPHINEAVALTATSTQIDAAVAGSIKRVSRIIITGNTGIIDSYVEMTSSYNGWSASSRLVDVGGDTEFNFLAVGQGFVINNGGSGFTGTPIAILSVDVVYNDTGLLDDTNLDYSIVSNDMEFHLYQKDGTELSWITTVNFPNTKKYEFIITYLTDA